MWQKVKNYAKYCSWRVGMSLTKHMDNNSLQIGKELLLMMTRIFSDTALLLRHIVFPVCRIHRVSVICLSVNHPENTGSVSV